jgi:4-aminobutyrate aminotransferase-like enzyme
LLLPCGESVIRFCPPLVVNAREVDTAVDIFASVLGEIQEEVRPI